MGARSLALLLGLAAFALSAAACSDSKSNESGDGDDDEGTDSADGEIEIVSRTRGGSSVASGVQPQAQVSVAGLTVRESARAKVAADRAFATFITYPSGPFPSGITSEQQDEVRAALGELGYAEDAVVIANDPRFGPASQIRVEVSVEDLPDAASEILDALDDFLSPQQSGVEFALSDCDPALRPLREEAFAKARRRAQEVAAAGDLALGPVVAVVEGQTQNIYGPPVSDPCDLSGNLALTGYPALLAPDSPAEVELVVDVAVTFALESAGDLPPKGVSAEGRGTVRARADEAYLVVLVETFSGPTGPRPLSERDRNAVLDKLVALGIAEDEIEFFSPPFGGPTVVSVETEDLQAVADLGDDVSDAVEEALGRTINKGVVFTHSNCEAAVREAMVEATADAREQAEALAEAADLTLSGEVLAVAESAGLFSPYGPAIDPCSEDLSVLANGYGAGIQPFDSEPEFEVTGVVTMTLGVR
jgi:uncharacterized protein YggE